MAMDTIKELDVVALTTNAPGQKLVRGQVGTVVTVYEPGAYEVEFVDSEGHTSDRAHWLGLALQRELRINPLPDVYEASASAAPRGVEGLQYGTKRQATGPAVDVYHPTGGGTVMRLVQCGLWHRNEVQVIIACVCSLGIFAALIPDRRGRLNPPSILFFGVIAAVAWFYVVWRRWSTTLIRAKEGVITIYRRSPLGLQKTAVLTTANARDLLVRDGTRVVAKNASGRDVPLFVENDASTQEAAIRFIRETLWPGQIAPEGPSGRDLPPPAQPQRSLTAPAGFTVHDGGWDLAVSGDFAALIRGILVLAVLAAALCWPLLHFHPWGIVWADVASILIGAGAALLISDGILAWLHPTRLEFDGDTLARVSSGLTGTQRLAWNRWQRSPSGAPPHLLPNRWASIRWSISSAPISCLRSMANEAGGPNSSTSRT